MKRLLIHAFFYDRHTFSLFWFRIQLHRQHFRAKRPPLTSESPPENLRPSPISSAAFIPVDILLDTGPKPL